MARARKRAVELPAGAPEPEGRGCDVPSCPDAGDHPAPRSRDNLRSYYWFCMDHARDYNKAWNYYAGLSETEIAALNRSDVMGRRPTWPMGRRANGRSWSPDVGVAAFIDQLCNGERERDGATAEPRHRPATEEEHALAVLDLAPPVTVGTIKTRYKKLAKCHHPDATGGDKAAEDRLKEINLAYSTLISRYGS